MLNRRPNTDVYHAPIFPSLEPRLGGVDTVGWELFIMGPQIRCGKTKAPAQSSALRHCSKNREFSSQERVGEVQGSAGDRRVDQSAAAHLFANEKGSSRSNLKSQVWRQPLKHPVGPGAVCAEEK